MRKAAFILLLVVVCACQYKYRISQDPKIYVGFVDEQYFEYWIYDSLVIQYDHEIRNLSKYKFNIDLDTLYPCKKLNLLFAYRVEYYNDSVLCLKNSKNSQASFERIDIEFKIDALDFYKNSLSSIDFYNEAWKRIELQEKME